MGFRTYNLVGADSALSAVTVVSEVLFTSSPSLLFSVIGYNDDVGTQWLQIHDVSATPTTALVPLISIAVATQTSGQIHFPLGRPMANGIYACWSSSDTTRVLTLTDGLIDAVYRVI